MPKSISFTSPSQREQQVLRRDVAVHDGERRAVLVGQAVRVLERRAHLARDVAGDGDRQRLGALARPPQQHAGVEPVHELQRDVELVVDLAELVGCDDVARCLSRSPSRASSMNIAT